MLPEEPGAPAEEVSTVPEAVMGAELGDGNQPLEPVVEASFTSASLAPGPEPFWGYTDLALVIGLLAAFVAVMLVMVGVLVALRPGLKEDPTPLLLPTQFALYGLVYITFRLIFSTRYGKPVFESLGWRRCNLHLVFSAVGGVALAFLVSGLASLLHTPKVPTPIDKLVETPWSLAIFGVMAVTVAPLFEELFFRGFIQPLLSRTFGVIAGILSTALLFGGMHAPEYDWAWQYVVAVGLAGAVFGWLRARTNSIIPSTIMHGCYNSVFVIALAVTKHT